MRLTALLFFITISVSGIGQQFRVMTFNIRYDNAGDGVNRWSERVDEVAALIRKYDPDIIGVQEALNHQLKDLVRLLPDYSWYGVGRDDGKEKGEYCAIMIKSGRFGLMEEKTFWLSEIPEVPGSKSWDAAITRIATRTRLFDKETKKEFLVMNTHFDHVGKAARKNSASLIKAYLTGYYESKQIPIILTGDFNFERSEDPYKLLTAEHSILLDSRPLGDHQGTYCGFEVGGMECKSIDYIFHTSDWIVRKYKVITDNDAKHYPSDHLPVLAEFEMVEN
jgi:endonuclease/exonuclease/phosphatase family metal-dependent hydrolase